MTTFGNLLKAMRESRGLSVYELAALSGYDRKSHYQYEIGDVAPPDADKIRDICQAMGTTGAECAALIQAAFDEHKERIRVKMGYAAWNVE